MTRCAQLRQIVTQIIQTETNYLAVVQQCAVRQKQGACALQLTADCNVSENCQFLPRCWYLFNTESNQIVVAEGVIRAIRPQGALIALGTVLQLLQQLQEEKLRA